jgi:hypothetical protein
MAFLARAARSKPIWSSSSHTPESAIIALTSRKERGRDDAALLCRRSGWGWLARPVTACTVQGMARVRSGQAPASPLSSDRSGRRGSGVKRDFACTSTRHRSPVLVVLRSQSRLRPEGRTRILSGPSADICSTKDRRIRQKITCRGLVFAVAFCWLEDGVIKAR